MLERNLATIPKLYLQQLQNLIWYWNESWTITSNGGFKLNISKSDIMVEIYDIIFDIKRFEVLWMVDFWIIP